MHCQNHIKFVEEIKIHVVCSKTFFFNTVPFMRYCGKNTVERGSPQITIWRMRIAC